MVASEDYDQLAQRCAQLAIACSTPSIACRATGSVSHQLRNSSITKYKSIRPLASEISSRRPTRKVPAVGALLGRCRCGLAFTPFVSG